jgi:tryptophan 7-halogenase
MITPDHTPGSATEVYSHGVKRVIILGGGLTGWTVAIALANGLRGMDIELVLIDTPAQTEVDLHCEASSPACVAFHQLLGITEQHLVANTGSSFLLATEFKAWADQQQQYFMPFNNHGFMFNRIEFSHYAVSRYLAGNPVNYDDYSLAAVAAKKGRFCHPSAQETSLFSTLSYGLTLNTEAYTSYLRKLALQFGVTSIAAEANLVNFDKQGFISSITLENMPSGHSDKRVGADQTLSADLFIDCSGISAQLIEKALQVEWNLSVSNSPVTHVLSSAQLLPSGAPLPVSRELHMQASGWVQKNTTQTQVEKQYYYHADFISVEQVSSELGVDADNYKTHKLQIGRREQFWYKNCIAIGASACNPDQLSIGKLHLIQSAVLRLISLFPSKINSLFNSAEYNRLTHLELDHIEDFHALHYRLAKTQVTEYWRQTAGAQLSDRLVHKMELFKQRGLIAFYEGETIPPGVWASLLLGNGFWPKRYDPLVNGVDHKSIDQQLEKMKTMMVSAAEKMPSQLNYLYKHQYKYDSPGHIL